MRPPHAGSRLVRRRRRRDMRALLQLTARILPHAMGHHPHGRARLLADLLPAARHRLRRHHPRRAQARTVLALCDSRDDRLGHRRHGHVLDRPQGRRTRVDAADEAGAARTRASPRIPSCRRQRRRAGDHSAPFSIHRVRPGQRRVRRSPLDVLHHARGSARRALPRRGRTGGPLRPPHPDLDAVDGLRGHRRDADRPRDRRDRDLRAIAVVRSTRRPKRQGAATFRS